MAQSIEEKRKKNTIRQRKRRADPEKRKKMNASVMQWYAANKDKQRVYMRNYHFMTKFGITSEQKDQMILDCGGVCEICFNKFIDRRDAHLDHNHVTNKIRGVLCGSCNRKLGWFEKNKFAVDEYLTKR